LSPFSRSLSLRSATCRYATSPQLNSFSALIHNFYTAESSPSPAIHLTLDPTSLAFTAYTASQIGTSPRPDHLAFIPVDSIMRLHEQERAGIDLLTQNLTSLSSSAQASKELGADLPVSTPLATMYRLLTKVSVMLDQVLEYVRAVSAGERQGDERVGRALLETVGVVPTAASQQPQQGAKKGTETKGFEEEFNAHLADVLMVSGFALLEAE
jgi:translation initiation factor 3 subunit F